MDVVLRELRRLRKEAEIQLHAPSPLKVSPVAKGWAERTQAAVRGQRNLRLSRHIRIDAEELA